MANSNDTVEIQVDINIDAAHIQNQQKLVSQAIQDLNKQFKSMADVYAKLPATSRRSMVGFTKTLESAIKDTSQLAAQTDNVYKSIGANAKSYKNLGTDLSGWNQYKSTVQMYLDLNKKALKTNSKAWLNGNALSKIRDYKNRIEQVNSALDTYEDRMTKSEYAQNKLNFDIQDYNRLKAEEATNQTKLDKQLRLGNISYEEYEQKYMASMERQDEYTDKIAKTTEVLNRYVKSYVNCLRGYEESSSELSTLEGELQKLLSSFNLTDQDIIEITSDLATWNDEMAETNGEISKLENKKLNPQLYVGEAVQDMNNYTDDNFRESLFKYADVIPKVRTEIQKLDDLAAKLQQDLNAQTNYSEPFKKGLKDLNKYEGSVKEIETTIKTYKNNPDIVPAKGWTNADKSCKKLIVQLYILKAVLQEIYDGGKSGVDGLAFEGYTQRIDDAIARLRTFDLTENVASENIKKTSSSLRRSKSAFDRFNSIVKKTNSTIKKTISLFKKLKSRLDKIINNFTKTFKRNGNQKTIFQKLFKDFLQFGLGVRTLFFLIRKMRTEFISGMQSLAKSIPDMNEQISEFTENVNVLRGSIITAFQPIASVVIPLLNKLMSGLTAAAKSVASFFATLSGQKVIYTAVSKNVDYAESVDDVAESTAEANKELGEYDNLLVITKNSDDDSDDDDYSFVESSVEPSASNFATMVKEAWEDADFTEVGNVVAQKIADALNSINWTKIKKRAAKFGSSIATFMNGFFGNLKLAKAIGKSIAQAINTGITFLKNFNDKIKWSNIAKFITKSIQTFLDKTDFAAAGREIFRLLGGALNTALKITGNDTTWNKIATNLAKFLAKLKWGKLVGKQFQLAANILSGIAKCLTKYLRKGLAKRDAKNLGNGLKTALEKSNWGELLGDLAEMAGLFIGAVLGAICDYIIEGKADEDFRNLGTGIGNGLKEIPWDKVFLGVKGLGSAILKGIGAAISAATGLDQETSEGIADAIGIGALGLGIANVISKIVSGSGLLSAFRKKDNALRKQTKATETETSAVKNYATKIVQAAAGAGALTGVVALITSLFSQNANAAENAATATEVSMSAQSTAVEGATSKVEAYDAALGKISETANSAATQTSEALSPIGGEFDTLSGKVGDFKTDLATIPEALGETEQSLQEHATNIKELIAQKGGEAKQSVTQNTSEATQAIQNGSEQMWKDTDLYSTKIKNKATSSSNGVKESVTNNAEMTQVQWQAKLQESYSDTAKATGNIKNNVDTTGRNVYQNVHNWADVTAGQFKTALKNTANNVYKWAVNVLTNIDTAMSGIGNSIYKALTNAGTNIANWINSSSGNIASWVTNTWNNLVTWGSGVINTIGNALASAWESVKSWFTATGESISGWYQANKSWVVPAAIATGVTVASIGLAPLTGGASLAGLGLLGLANGAVIPPNKEFLAVLGDQKSGTNIEAPLDTIKQALAEVLVANGSGNNQPIVLQLSGKEVARVVWSEEQKQYKQTGSYRPSYI